MGQEQALSDLPVRQAGCGQEHDESALPGSLVHVVGAHPSLQLDAPLRPGEEIAVLGMTEEGLLRFSIPAFAVRVRAHFDGCAPLEVRLAIDTVLIEPSGQLVGNTTRSAPSSVKMRAVSGKLPS